MAHMVAQAIHLVAPVLALGVMFCAHAARSRMDPSAPMLNSLAGAGFLGLMALAIVEVVVLASGQTLGEVFLSALLVDFPIFACLAYGYANFVNLGQSSVRVRIYRELLAADDGIAMETLRVQYDERSMLEARLQRLVSAGDLKHEDACYTLGKPRLLLIARVVFALKHFVLGRRSEF